MNTSLHPVQQRLNNILLGKPWLTMLVVAIVTIFFASRIPAVRLLSDFADLVPQEHPYIQLHNEIRDSFGGANNIIVSVEVDEGSVVTAPTLRLIHELTQQIDNLHGVNHNLVSSLTHRTTRKVWLNENGGVNSAPYYDPLQEQYSAADLEQFRNDITSNPSVYGLLVSHDLRAALIKATLNEGQLDYEQTFNELQAIRGRVSGNGVRVYATGQPVLIGWVASYVEEIVQIFLYTLLIILAILVLYFRRLYGVVIPLIGVVLTSIWGIGILGLLGYNLDPLMMVVPFLISARAMSHGIQLVERYYSELGRLHDSKRAASETFNALFRPGSLGVISDAIGLLVIAVGSVPINDKLAHYASLWALSVMVTVLITVPCLLTILPQPKTTAERANPIRDAFPVIARNVSKSAVARNILLTSLVVLLIGGLLSSNVQIGEAESGSPLLHTDHDFNESSRIINSHFPGSEELFIVARSAEPGGLKNPEYLAAINDFQNHMLMDPELGGAKGLPDLVKAVNRILHNDDPRWELIPHSASYVGGLLFAYMASSPIPGALLEFIDTDEQNANLVFYYKDHRGETIRRALHQAKEWIDNPNKQIDGLSFLLAGGNVGVTAAINEAAFNTNVIIVPLVFFLIFIFVTVFYRSFHAGWLMLMAMSFATTLAYAYMGLAGIGINVNTVPIIAVGIGVGIDYSIYMMDRIREQMRGGDDYLSAIKHAMSSTGVAIAVTATTLIAGVVMWVFISSLRFQADAALLLCVMLIFNALGAIFLVPAWITLFKPEFLRQKS